MIKNLVEFVLEIIDYEKMEVKFILNIIFEDKYFVVIIDKMWY